MINNVAVPCRRGGLVVKRGCLVSAPTTPTLCQLRRFSCNVIGLHCPLGLDQRRISESSCQTKTLAGKITILRVDLEPVPSALAGRRHERRARSGERIKHDPVRRTEGLDEGFDQGSGELGRVIDALGVAADRCNDYIRDSCDP